jgi:hypothetical protein
MITKTEPLDGEDLINYDDVTARIAYLEEHDCHNPDPDGEGCDSDFSCPSCYGDAEEELAALRALRDDMEAANRASGRASALRDSYLETYVRDELEGIYGEEVFSALNHYIKWGELTGDRADEMEEVTFRGTTYYITP